MVEIKLTIKTLIYACVLCCFSCANLEHINKYAHNSIESIDKFKEIPFSFDYYCHHYQEASLTNSIQDDIAPLPKLDCGFYFKSDTALNIFNNILKVYLQGLEKLSAKDLVAYDLSNAANNLQALQGKVGWPISESQVTATRNILATVLNGIVNHFRKKRLKEIIQGSKNDFKIVIEAYITGISAMQEEAKLALRNYQDFYSNPLLEMSSEKALKVLLVRNFHQQEDVFEKVNQSIENYLKILGKIESGYIKLSNSSNRLTADDLKTSLQQCVDDLKYLKAQIGDLKTIN